MPLIPGRRISTSTTSGASAGSRCNAASALGYVREQRTRGSEFKSATRLSQVSLLSSMIATEIGMGSDWVAGSGVITTGAIQNKRLKLFLPRQGKDDSRSC